MASSAVWARLSTEKKTEACRQACVAMCTCEHTYAPVPPSPPDPPDEEQALEVGVRLRDVLHDALGRGLPAGERLPRAPGARPVIFVLQVLLVVLDHAHVGRG